MTGPSVGPVLKALLTFQVAGRRHVYINTTLACGRHSALGVKHPGDPTCLAEQHFDEQLFLSLQSLEELSQHFPNQPFPLGERLAATVESLRPFYHGAEECQNIYTVEQKSLILLESYQMEETVGPLQLYGVKVVVVTSEADKCVYSALGDELRQESGKFNCEFGGWSPGTNAKVAALITGRTVHISIDPSRSSLAKWLDRVAGVREQCEPSQKTPQHTDEDMRELGTRV